MANDETTEGTGEGEHLSKKEQRALAEMQEQHEALLAPAQNFYNVVPGTAPVSQGDGYISKTLRGGVVQYYSTTTAYNTPDEAQMRAHVADYRARKSGYVSG